MSIKSLVCNSEEVCETLFTADSGTTVDVDWAPFSNSRKEFSSNAMVRASSGVAGLLFSEFPTEGGITQSFDEIREDNLLNEMREGAVGSTR